MSRPGTPVRVGLKLAQDAPIETFRKAWRVADQAGFDHCWAFDHLATRDSNGNHRVVFEGWTLLAAMAEATRRTRIGLLVTGMRLRHPALLAKQAVTVDHLSGGRLEFGIGAGWSAVEQAMFGIGGQDRPVARLAEGLHVMKLLWGQQRSSFRGQFSTLSDAVGNPRPIQQPAPPIWIGAAGPAMLRIVARHADVWNPAADGLEAARAAGKQLLASCHDVGRDPAEIRWSTQLEFDGNTPSAMFEQMRRWHAAGFTELIISCTGPEPVKAAEVAAEKLLRAARELL